MGQKKPNAWGLYDILGNTSEWVYDLSRPYDKHQPISSDYYYLFIFLRKHRIHRGGSWDYRVPGLRAAGRNHKYPSDRYYNVGIRLVRSRDISHWRDPEGSIHVLR